MKQINIQLYGRAATTQFSEDLSARQSVQLSPDPSTVELSLEARKGQSFVEIRIDPADKPCSFILHDLKFSCVPRSWSPPLTRSNSRERFDRCKRASASH